MGLPGPKGETVSYLCCRFIGCYSILCYPKVTYYSIKLHLCDVGSVWGGCS